MELLCVSSVYYDANQKQELSEGNRNQRKIRKLLRKLISTN